MDPFKKMASMLDKRMAEHAGNALSGIPCELGTIAASGLKLDSFKHEIQDYLVADWLVKIYLPGFTITGEQAGLKDSFGGAVTGQAIYTFQPTTIDEVHLELKADLRVGDRVLAIPVNGGQDSVVICKVVPNA